MAARKSLTANGGYSAGVAARISGINYRTLARWIDNGLVTPSVHQGQKNGDWDRFSFSDLVILHAIGQLKTGGISLAKIKKALMVLKQIRQEQELEHIHLVGNGRDIFLWQGDELTSLLHQPGQQAFLWAIPLGTAKQEVETALAQVA